MFVQLFDRIGALFKGDQGTSEGQEVEAGYRWNLERVRITLNDTEVLVEIEVPDYVADLSSVFVADNFVSVELFHGDRPQGKPGLQAFYRATLPVRVKIRSDRFSAEYRDNLLRLRLTRCE